jgi:hypothetical protein
MSISHKPTPQNPHFTLIQKLHPIRFPKMSGVMAAIVAYVLGTTFIEPVILELEVTSDGFVLAQPEGHVGAPQYLGRYSGLLRNWSRLIAAAGLTLAERIEAECLFASRVGYFGPVTA